MVKEFDLVIVDTICGIAAPGEHQELSSTEL